MAVLHNNQPVVGVKLLDDGAKLFNSAPVIGVRAASGAFDTNQVVRKIEVVADGVTIFNSALVIGAVVITDGRKLYNNRPVVPVTGLPA